MGFGKSPIQPGMIYKAPEKIRVCEGREVLQSVQIYFHAKMEKPLVLVVEGTQMQIKHWLSKAAKECFQRPVTVHVAVDAFFASRSSADPVKIVNELTGKNLMTFVVTISSKFWTVGMGLPRIEQPTELSHFRLVNSFKIECSTGKVIRKPFK